MRRILSIILVCVLMGSILCACGAQSDASQKPVVVTTLFPQYDFARQIAGEYAQVDMLLSPGSESHMYDPTPSDMLKISRSALFVYTGETMEPWAHEIIDSFGEDAPMTVDCSQGVTLIGTHEHSEEQGHDEEHDEHTADAHIWLNLLNSAVMVDNIAAGLCTVMPEHKDEFLARAQELKNELLEIDAQFEDIFKGAENSTLVFGGRFSYIYFIDRYGIDYVTAYTSCSANAEPSVAEIAAVAEYINQNDVPVIFREELSTATVANSIAQDTGAQVLQFSTAHNVTKDEFDSGITFCDIMRSNMENIREAVGE